MEISAPPVHLRRGGTSVVVSLTEERLPRILYWGEDLGDLAEGELQSLERSCLPTVGDSVVTYPQPVPVLPQLAEGWLGGPGLAGARDGRSWAPLFHVTNVTLRSAEHQELRVEAVDAPSELKLDLELRLEPSGLLRQRAHLRNLGTAYRVDRLELSLPVPDVAEEILDLTGRWAFERVPQRHPFPIGRWARESRGGKPGLGAPLVMIAGEQGFGFRHGRLWGVHLAWSGNQLLAAERVPAASRMLRAGEVIHPDEVVLQRGETLVTPWMTASWGKGLDEFAARFHQFLRSRATHPTTPRPVLVNTWEAVYFDHDQERLLDLAERSAAVGAERFVVDDGWFLGRRDDTTSLGDWVVDPQVWPEGLDPLAERVHALGMEFGLWFEPEMINLDSRLAREHPDWVFDAGHGPGLPSRHQHVLDLGHDEAYALACDRISALVARLGIDYIKWDHNRYLTDAGHTPAGEAGVRRQTLRAYQLMSELKARNPGLEIESCAAGGGRVDLGVLAHTDRVWDSDCNDPHDRIDIHRWTSLVLPPELQGTHIGAAESHTTGRTSTLGFRAATMLWGHLGIELDLTRMSDEEFEAVRRWVGLHRELRGLLHSGTVVHGDTQPETRLDGVVAAGGEEAVYQFTVLDRPVAWPPARLRLPGLDQERRYRVEELGEPVPTGQRPPWLDTVLVLPGRVLETHGLEAPSLDVDRAVLFRVTAVDVS